MPSDSKSDLSNQELLGSDLFDQIQGLNPNLNRNLNRPSESSIKSKQSSDVENFLNSKDSIPEDILKKYYRQMNRGTESLSRNSSKGSHSSADQQNLIKSKSKTSQLSETSESFKSSQSKNSVRSVDYQDSEDQKLMAQIMMDTERLYEELGVQVDGGDTSNYMMNLDSDNNELDSESDGNADDLEIINSQANDYNDNHSVVNFNNPTRIRDRMNISQLNSSKSKVSNRSKDSSKLLQEVEEQFNGSDDYGNESSPDRLARAREQARIISNKLFRETQENIRQEEMGQKTKNNTNTNSNVTNFYPEALQGLIGPGSGQGSVPQTKKSQNTNTNTNISPGKSIKSILQNLKAPKPQATSSRSNLMPVLDDDDDEDEDVMDLNDNDEDDQKSDNSDSDSGSSVNSSNSESNSTPGSDPDIKSQDSDASSAESELRQRSVSRERNRKQQLQGRKSSRTDSSKRVNNKFGKKTNGKNQKKPEGKSKRRISIGSQQSQSDSSTRKAQNRIQQHMDQNLNNSARKLIRKQVTVKSPNSISYIQMPLESQNTLSDPERSPQKFENTDFRATRSQSYSPSRYADINDTEVTGKIGSPSLFYQQSSGAPGTSSRSPNRVRLDNNIQQKRVMKNQQQQQVANDENPYLYEMFNFKHNKMVDEDWFDSEVQTHSQNMNGNSQGPFKSNNNMNGIKSDTQYTDQTFNFKGIESRFMPLNSMQKKKRRQEQLQKKNKNRFKNKEEQEAYFKNRRNVVKEMASQIERGKDDNNHDSSNLNGVEMNFDFPQWVKTRLSESQSGHILRSEDLALHMFHTITTVEQALINGNDIFPPVTFICVDKMFRLAYKRFFSWLDFDTVISSLEEEHNLNETGKNKDNATNTATATTVTVTNTTNTRRSGSQVTIKSQQNTANIRQANNVKSMNTNVIGTEQQMVGESQESLDKIKPSTVIRSQVSQTKPNRSRSSSPTNRSQSQTRQVKGAATVSNRNSKTTKGTKGKGKNTNKGASFRFYPEPRSAEDLNHNEYINDLDQDSSSFKEEKSFSKTSTLGEGIPAAIQTLNKFLFVPETDPGKVWSKQLRDVKDLQQQERKLHQQIKDHYQQNPQFNNNLNNQNQNQDINNPGNAANPEFVWLPKIIKQLANDPNLDFQSRRRRSLALMRQCVMMRAEDRRRLAVLQYIRENRTEPALFKLQSEFQAIDRDLLETRANMRLVNSKNQNDNTRNQSTVGGGPGGLRGTTTRNNTTINTGTNTRPNGSDSEYGSVSYNYKDSAHDVQTEYINGINYAFQSEGGTQSVTGSLSNDSFQINPYDDRNMQGIARSQLETQREYDQIGAIEGTRRQIKAFRDAGYDEIPSDLIQEHILKIRGKQDYKANLFNQNYYLADDPKTRQMLVKGIRPLNNIILKQNLVSVPKSLILKFLRLEHMRLKRMLEGLAVQKVIRESRKSSSINSNKNQKTSVNDSDSSQALDSDRRTEQRYTTSVVTDGMNNNNGFGGRGPGINMFYQDLNLDKYIKRDVNWKKKEKNLLKRYEEDKKLEKDLKNLKADSVKNSPSPKSLAQGRVHIVGDKRKSDKVSPVEATNLSDSNNISKSKAKNKSKSQQNPLKAVGPDFKFYNDSEPQWENSISSNDDDEDAHLNLKDDEEDDDMDLRSDDSSKSFKDSDRDKKSESKKKQQFLFMPESPNSRVSRNSRTSVNPNSKPKRVSRRRTGSTVNQNDEEQNSNPQSLNTMSDFITHNIRINGNSENRGNQSRSQSQSQSQNNLNNDITGSIP